MPFFDTHTLSRNLGALVIAVALDTFLPFLLLALLHVSGPTVWQIVAPVAAAGRNASGRTCGQTNPHGTRTFHWHCSTCNQSLSRAYTRHFYAVRNGSPQRTIHMAAEAI